MTSCCGAVMSGFPIRQDPCALDFLSLGALVYRLDPGLVPFRKARGFDIHVSGGEYNVAAGLADCFGLRTGIATAMVHYGIGEVGQGPGPARCGAPSSPMCLPQPTRP